MRLRIRTLLLTVALLCSMTSTSSACIYIPILDPFYWLFGGCGYGSGGASGGGYGYVNNGNSYGYGPNPYGVSRCVDDWLGYGYLRNQQGTLGHYPGRPIKCYTPVFPRLLNPCAWFPPCPLFAPYAPYGPACGITAPMVAPLAAPMQMPYPQYQMPMPAMVNPYGGMCNNSCGPQCAPQPMPQYLPPRMPAPAWGPMPANPGYGQRLWVPQPQYITSAPAMQMPIMGAPMMNSAFDFDGDCGCGGDGMIQGAEMMQGSDYPDMDPGSGCCGSDGGMPQQGFESALPANPQSTMMMSPDSMTMSRMPMSRMQGTRMQMSWMSMGQPHNIAPYSSMSRWYSNPGTPTAFTSPSYGRSMPPQPTYGTAMFGPQPRNFANNMAMMPVQQNSGWQIVPGSTTSVQLTQQQMAQQIQMAQMRPQQLRPVPMPQTMNGSPMTVQMMPQQFTPMQHRAPMSQMNGRTGPVAVTPRRFAAGDISGDHELTGPIPVVPNSFNGRAPIQQASWSQPVRTSTAQKYPNSVQ